MSQFDEAAQAAAIGPILSANDAARLELMAYEEPSELRAQIFAKLTNARLVSGNEIGPDIATIGSIVHYQIGNAHVERRTLSLPEVTRPNGQFINLLTPVGLALLGARAGDTIAVTLVDGGSLTLQLHEVEFQPEAEVRRRSTWVSDDGPGAA